MNEHSIGVHIITKDEAELLPQCLESVQHADEIIVIDTGSKDSSVLIAQSYGAHVITMDWENDFSKPRNEALRHAHTEWILMLDADERLLTPLHIVEEQLTSIDSHIQAITVIVDNLVSKQPENRVTHQALRLFRNNENYEFRGIIHEQIEASIIEKHGLSSISNSDIQIIHLGYLPKYLYNKNKVARNHTLLQQALKEMPDDPFLLYNMGITHCQAGQLEQSQHYLEQSLLLAPLNQSYRANLIRDLCKIYLELNLTQPLDILLIHELNRYSNYPDLHFLLGQSLERQGLLERANDAYQNATSCTIGTLNPRYITEMGVAHFLPHCHMGMIAQQLGRMEDAARHFHLSLQFNPLYIPSLKGITSSFHQLDVPDKDIHTLLQQLVNPQTTEDHHLIIEALKEIQAHQSIVNYSQQSYISNPRILLDVCTSLITTSRLEEASHLFNQQMPHLSYDDLTVASQMWAICQWQQDPGDLQDNFYVNMPLDMCKRYEFVDQILQVPSDTTKHHYPTDILELVISLVRHSVLLHQLEIAQHLIEHFPEAKLTYASTLYAQGDTMTAADILLSLLQQDLLDDEARIYLGEILIDKGHYSQGAAWFEQLLQTHPRNEKIITAISICYLHLAESYITEALELTDNQHNSPLQEDLHSIRSAILILNRTGWHTTINLNRTTKEVSHD
ncbi:tetratricopeptide repeat-containing glycosyltransferase family 2 protein [Paenibacillus macquariensis]|uniref:Glycosyltransferase involved in cell wall bisynthesis n=1 Tax=Paenibacillus macquariensis TaxID=948756 RepID=A0ABY1KBL1_9BACL|nr:TPR domain-containing glycosyltransferase [Paenibacillus macquariensis]MEC0094288.1 glycosyltransferase [Paenibacillus macquariensis]OAB32178.1 hypothetical protein PMSM_18145 [Paenibacillus macquariensis subsp. macquariensis]SIR55709.1 Glycosyltransferase involved in cell wall bisynthesis [Paenibacillus macquariensis]